MRGNARAFGDDHFPSLHLNFIENAMMSCRCRSNTLGLFIRSVAQIDLSATSNFAAAGRLRRPLHKYLTTTRQFRTQRQPHRFYSTSAADSPTAALAVDNVTDSAIKEDSLTSTSASDESLDNEAPNSTSTGNGLVADTITENASRHSPNHLAFSREGSQDGDVFPAGSAFLEFSIDALDELAAEGEAYEREHNVQRESMESLEARLKAAVKDMPKPRKDERERRAPAEGSYETPLNALLQDLPKKKERLPTDATISRRASRSIFRDPEPAGLSRRKDDWTPPPREHWMIDKAALKKKFPDGYQPLKRLSPDAISGIRALHAQMPERYTAWALSQEFQVSPEAIRRILKSKWTPDATEESDRAERWFRRGERIWSRYSELGVKPPKKWREAGIGKPEWMLKKKEKYAYEVPPLPALVTTSRVSTPKRKETARTNAEIDLDSVADGIL